MHFSEIRGFILLTMLLTCGILIAGRLAPDQIAMPAQVMTKAMNNAERTARDTRGRDEAGAAARPLSGSGGGGGGSGGGAIAPGLSTGGHMCAGIRRIAPIDGGHGIYLVTCGDAAGNERSYRLDTRSGQATDADRITA